MAVHERDLVVPALRAAAASPGGEITTSKLIDVLTDHFGPQGHDAKIIDGRQDTYFSQKARNLVCHRGTSTSMFTRGYAEHLPESESIRITEAGRAYVQSKT